MNPKKGKNIFYAVEGSEATPSLGSPGKPARLDGRSHSSNLHIYCKIFHLSGNKFICVVCLMTLTIKFLIKDSAHP